MILDGERLTENRGKINPKRKGKTKFKFALELTLTIWTLANKDKKQSLLQWFAYKKQNEKCFIHRIFVIVLIKRGFCKVETYTYIFVGFNFVSNLIVLWSIIFLYICGN